MKVILHNFGAHYIRLDLLQEAVEAAASQPPGWRGGIAFRDGSIWSVRRNRDSVTVWLPQAGTP